MQTPAAPQFAQRVRSPRPARRRRPVRSCFPAAASVLLAAASRPAARRATLAAAFCPARPSRTFSLNHPAKAPHARAGADMTSPNNSATAAAPIPRIRAGGIVALPFTQALPQHRCFARRTSMHALTPRRRARSAHPHRRHRRASIPCISAAVWLAAARPSILPERAGSAAQPFACSSIAIVAMPYPRAPAHSSAFAPRRTAGPTMSTCTHALSGSMNRSRKHAAMLAAAPCPGA